jgi:hypothetical protein
MSLKADVYKITLTLTREMLGTNPVDPNILDTHIINKQRELILEKCKLNKEVNKYLDALPIAKQKGEAEVDALMDKLEELFGIELDSKGRAKILAEGLDALKETMAEQELRGITLFLWNKQKKLPMIGDHMIYGFLKAAAEAVGRTLPRKMGTALNSASFTQSLINQHIRCTEQFITFDRDIKRNNDGSAYYLQRSLRAQTAQGPRITLAKSEVIEAGASLTFVLKVMQNCGITEEVLDTLFSYGEWVGLGQWRNAGNGMFTYTLQKGVEKGGGTAKKKQIESRIDA